MVAGIVTTEDVLGGNPRLKDHRISVLDVVEMLKVGYSPSEAAEELHIELREVQAALRYYRLHREEIEAQAREREALHDQLIEESRAPSA